jgi:hypothetical protein
MKAKRKKMVLAKFPPKTRVSQNIFNGATDSRKTIILFKEKTAFF